MESREDRKKALERMYLESFLSLSGRFADIEPFERPDFLMTGSEGKYGVEVTLFFKDESESGSATKRNESDRTRFLGDLARFYYSAGGKPINVQAILPELPEKKFLPAAAADLSALRETLQPWEQGELLTDNASKGFLFRALAAGKPG